MSKRKHKNQVLTPRETEILNLLSNGLRVKEVAKRLKISQYTVQAHIRNIYVTTQCRSLPEVVSKFLKQELPTIDLAGLKLFNEIFCTEQSPIVRWHRSEQYLPPEGAQVIIWSDRMIKGFYLNNVWFDDKMVAQHTPRLWCLATLHPYAKPADNGSPA